MTISRDLRRSWSSTRSTLACFLAAATVISALFIVPGNATAAPTWELIASDSFNRTVTNGWGVAEQGGSYSTVNLTGGSVGVANGMGRIDSLQPGQTIRSGLSVLALDVAIQGSLELPVGQTSEYRLLHSWTARDQSTGAGYRATVSVDRTGKGTLNVSRTGPASKSFDYTDLGVIAPPGQVIVGELEVTGTSPVTIRARAWQSGKMTPGWAITVIDPGPERVTAAGGASLVDYATATSAVSLAVDDLAVRRLVPTQAAPSASPPATIASALANTVSAPPLPAMTTTGVPSSPPRTLDPTPTPSTTETTLSATPVTPARTVRGARAIGTASYAVPPGAIFVDAAVGNDASAGAQAAPLRTLSAAIAKAASGTTIVLRKGTYNESVVIPSGKSLTIQNYPLEAVWMDGSIPVRAWVKSGSKWVSSGWTAQFSSSMDGIPDNPRFVDPAHPMAARPDQVFLNGIALAQATSPASVTPGTFAVDYANRTLTIGSDPTGSQVRASNLGQAIYVKSKGTTLQGFGVRRYATGYDLRGTIKMENINSTIRNMTVVDNATIGVTVSNNGAIIDGITVKRSGLLGLGLNAAYGANIRNSVVAVNNIEQFKPAPVSGGIKVTRSRGLTIVNNDTSSNVNSGGLWLDESCYDIVIANNTSNNNPMVGIDLELSQKAIIVNNETNGNGAGLMLYNSGDVQVYNNNFGGNRLFGVKLGQDERRQATHSVGRDPRRPVPDPTVPWLTHNIVVSNNVFGNGGAFQFYGLDGRTHIPVDAMAVTIDGNLFTSRTATSDPTMVAWGAADNKTLARYETPQALAAAKNAAWRNAITPTSTPIGAMRAYITAAATVARPLPADVAAAAGVAAGTKRVGRY